MTTPDLAGLCERLRAERLVDNSFGGGKFIRTNPDGPEAAVAIESLVAAGWRTDAENAPKDGRWIVVIDKFRNCDAIRWSNETSRFDPDQRERGWVSKFGGANTAPEHCVAWSEMPALEGASDDR